jgi:hypothetical protein
VTLFAIGLLVAIVRAARSQDRKLSLFIFTLLPFPLLYAFVYAKIGNAVPKPQYLLPAAALVFGVIALAADAVRRRTLRINRTVSWVAFASVLIAVGVPMAAASIDSVTQRSKRDWRGVMTHLRNHSDPEDAFAVIASDTVPASYYPDACGRARYGLGPAKFLRVSLRTKLDELSTAPWTRSDNTVWIIAYTDRMYLGTDQLAAPPSTRPGVTVHEFDGLLLTEMRGNQTTRVSTPTSGRLPASDRLMDGFSLLVDNANRNGALIAAPILRGKWLLARGRENQARDSFDAALDQCRNQTDRTTLRREHIPPTVLAEND